MMTCIPSLADALDVGATSSQFALSLDTSGPIGAHVYRYVASVDSWISQGTAPTASAGSGSMFVPAGVEVYLDGANGPTLAVIQDSTGGKASLCPVIRV